MRTLRALLPLLALASVALAGCSDGDSHGHTVTCDDGTEVDYAEEDHHGEDFDPMSLCAPPPLVLTFSGVPESLMVYRSAALSWGMELGGRESAHSMLTSLRVATASKNVTAADGPDAYGSELLKREHQDLPFAYEAPVVFDTPGTYYLRTYAVVSGEHHWSPEARVEVTPVQPTGTAHTVTHAPGDFLGGVSPTAVQMALGDALVFQNDDLLGHVFTFTSGPASVAEVAVAAQSASDPVLLPAPGTYEVSTDDFQSARITITVAPPS